MLHNILCGFQTKLPERLSFDVKCTDFELHEKFQQEFGLQLVATTSTSSSWRLAVLSPHSSASFSLEWLGTKLTLLLIV